MLEGVTYLIVVDYFSRFPEAIKLTSVTSQSVITALKSVFSRYGIPEIVVTDNGPQFASQEFAEFAISYNFTHSTSSPQSNGHVERVVKTVKTLLRRSDDPYTCHYCRIGQLPYHGVTPRQLSS